MSLLQEMEKYGLSDCKFNRKLIKNYLDQFEFWFDEVQLDCWVDFEPADPSTGHNASAQLIRAYVHNTGADISDLLHDKVIKIIEAAAASHLQEQKNDSLD